jgi:hypothetical protein
VFEFNNIVWESKEVCIYIYKRRRSKKLKEKIV